MLAVLENSRLLGLLKFKHLHGTRKQKLSEFFFFNWFIVVTFVFVTAVVLNFMFKLNTKNVCYI